MSASLHSRTTELPLFPLGQVVATPGALALVERLGINLFTLLHRHEHGDWGDLPHEDIAANNSAVAYGGRIFSGYTLAGGERIWIITEHDRSVTTALLPEEY